MKLKIKTKLVSAESLQEDSGSGGDRFPSGLIVGLLITLLGSIQGLGEIATGRMISAQYDCQCYGLSICLVCL